MKVKMTRDEYQAVLYSTSLYKSWDLQVVAKDAYLAALEYARHAKDGEIDVEFEGGSHQLRDEAYVKKT